MAKKVLTHHLSEPLCGATVAKIEINTDTGNLTIDKLAGGEPLLASGTLEYLEGQDLPVQSMNTINGQATFSVKAAGAMKKLFLLPWAKCNGATDWQVHLNPSVRSDITARSGGGNVVLNLAGMVVTQVLADTGGGNMNVVLPDGAANLNVTARSGGGNVTVEIGSATTGSNTINANSGAGNVEVRLPGSIAARIHASTGVGKIIVGSRFTKIDNNTFQSPEYDKAADRVEITVKSGAGNAIISTH